MSCRMGAGEIGRAPSFFLPSFRLILRVPHQGCCAEACLTLPSRGSGRAGPPPPPPREFLDTPWEITGTHVVRFAGRGGQAAMAAGCACVKARGTVDGNRHARARYARGVSWSSPLSRGRHRAGRSPIVSIRSSATRWHAGHDVSPAGWEPPNFSSFLDDLTAL